MHSIAECLVNMMKWQDRAEVLVRRWMEMDAIENGQWPRGANDDLRWHMTAVCGTVAERMKLVEGLIRAEIEYLEGVESRVDAMGWEATPRGDLGGINRINVHPFPGAGLCAVVRPDQALVLPAEGGGHLMTLDEAKRFADLWNEWVDREQG